MSKKDKMDINLNMANILAFAKKRYRILFVIALIAAIVTAIMTLFMDNIYKSRVILFPAAQVSVTRTLVDGNYGKGKGELLSPGEQEELDELQQVLNSEDLTRKIIEKFKLMEYYEIDPHAKGAYKKTMGYLSSNMKISRTEYGSVSIDVWDKKPEMAAEIANFIPKYVDTIFYMMEKDRVEKSYIIIKQEYDSVTNHLMVLEDSLHKFNKKGVIDIAPQTEELTKAYYKALIKGQTAVANKVQQQLNIIQENVSKFILLRDDIVYVQRQQSFLASKLTIANVGLREKVTRKFIVSNAHVADYKDAPKRSIIVVVAAIAAFFTALFAFIIAESLKKLK